MFGTTYANKMHLLFGSSFQKNFIVKRARLGAILRLMTFWDVSRKVCEWVQNMQKRLVFVWGVSRQFLKLYGMLQVVIERTSANTIWFRNKPSGSWWACNSQGWRGWEVIAGAQGMPMSGSWKLLNNWIHIRMRGILRLCRYETAWCKDEL